LSKPEEIEGGSHRKLEEEARGGSWRRKLGEEARGVSWRRKPQE
jgi:hypothetical protein